MAHIATFFNERFVSQQVAAMVDETETSLMKRDHLIDKYFPTQTFDSRDFMGLLTNRVAPAASIVAYGAEIPLVSFGGVERIAAQLCKIGVSRLYDEQNQWDMLKAREIAIDRGVKVQTVYKPDGTTQKGANNDLASHLFGTIEDLLRGVTDRMDMMKWQALLNGAVDLKDPKTGALVSLDFKKSGVSYNHFPLPLTQTGNTVEPHLNKWSDLANGQALQNLYDAVETYNDTNGFMPDKIVMSRKLWNTFLQQKSTRDAARQMTTTELGLVSTDMGKELLKKRDLPEIVTMDEKFQEELPTGEVVPVNFMPTNRFAFVKEDMGISAIGPTIESSNTVVGGSENIVSPKSGIWVSTYEQNKQPVHDVSMAIATFLPIVMNSKLLYSQVVN